jgi:CRISPR-associated endonuclease/helicase Cas3
MYWAHYNKKVKQRLPEHLQSVSKGCRSALSEYINFDGITAEQFATLTELCGKYHDLGKYTDFFQDYMLLGQDSPDKDHAHISALFVYNLLNGTADSRPNLNMIISFFCYLAVRLHHGNLRVHGLNMKPQDMLQTLQNKQKNLLQNAEKILQEFPEQCSRQDFENFLNLDNSILQNICDIPHYFKSARLKNAQWFFFLILLFSLLIDQDKLDSAQIATKDRNQIGPERIPAYLAEKNKGKQRELDERRENARKEIMEALSKMTDQEILDNRIYTLTAPTGIGKTLASLQAAAYLSRRLKGLGLTKVPKIITVIPFVNIIEQNLEDYLNICGEDISLLAHYHLGQVEEHADQNQPLEKVLLETEAWEADVIITTYVQLLQSLLSDRNRSLKKINKLAGSIVIMDEVQALPDEYMPLIGAVIRRVSAHYGTRFILMTATQPKIMEFADLLKDDIGKMQSSIELLPNNETYFAHLRRTRFISLIEDSVISEDEFLEKFKEKYSEKKTALIVVNTIKRSLNLYAKLQKQYPRRVLYLSTNIIPVARKKVIRRAKRYWKYGIPFILVSTQTIEAGVDLDFDMAFRDLAPLPSLIQTAGRVNRNNGKGEPLPVYITEIENDCGLVYGTDQKNRIKTILSDKTVIGEEEYRALVDDYYSKLLQQGLPDESKKIWEKGIIELNFEYVNQFELIKKSHEIADVFVEYDDTATQLADLYIVLRQQLRQADKEEYFGIKARLQNTMAAMQQYFLSIRVKRIIGNRPLLFEDRSLGEIKSDFYWIPRKQLNDYYDLLTGFKDEGGAYIY